MKLRADCRQKVIGDALKGTTSGSVKRVGNAGWKFALSNGASAPGSARLDDGWLLMEVALDGGIKDSGWRMAQWNGLLEGYAKFALAAGHARLRAEIPFDFEEGIALLPLRISESCRGFSRAMEFFHGEVELESESPPLDELQESRPEKDSPAGILEQTGWPFTSRDGGECVVQLEAGGAFFQAVVERPEGHRVVVRAQIGSWEALSAVSREALGHFLLNAASVVRMARPAVDEAGKNLSARFEVCHCSPHPEELAHSLSALSVACSLCAREAKALEDEEIARAYLATRGSSPWSLSG